DRAEQQEEHQRERQRGHAVDGQPEHLEELEARLGDDELEEVATGAGLGGPGGDGGGSHASTSTFSVRGARGVKTAGPAPPVMLRNASSRDTPLTSSPMREPSRFSSARTLPSAAAGCR